MLKRIAAVSLLHLLLVFTFAARPYADGVNHAKPQAHAGTEITLCTTLAATAVNYSVQAESYASGLNHNHSPIKDLLVDIAALLRQKDTRALTYQRHYTYYSKAVAYSPPTHLIFPFHYFT